MEFEVEKNRLIGELRQRGISERVLDAMRSVPRHLLYRKGKKAMRMSIIPCP